MAWEAGSIVSAPPPSSPPAGRGPSGAGAGRGGAGERPPSKTTLPPEVAVIVPLLVVRPVMRVWSLRTVIVAPGWLVRLPMTLVGPTAVTAPKLVRLVERLPKPVIVPPAL